MLASRLDFMIAGTGLSALALTVFWWESRQPLDSSSATDAAPSVAPVAFVNSETLPPVEDAPIDLEPVPVEVAETETPSEPVEPEPVMTVYQGGGNRATELENTPEPQLETPTPELVSLPSSEIPQAIPVADPSAPPEAKADSSEMTSSGSEDDHVAGDLNAEGLDAPAYQIANTMEFLPDLVKAGHALVAVVDMETNHLHYTTSLDKPAFEYAPYPNRVGQFAFGRFVRIRDGQLYVALCRERNPISAAGGDPRIYFSRALDAHILSAQREAAAERGVPLHSLLLTAGRFQRSPDGGGIIFQIEGVTLRPGYAAQ